MNKHEKQIFKTINVWSEASHCKRAKVGCAIAFDSDIISIGLNGTPSGFDNNCEDEDGTTKKEVIHAEINALMKCAKRGIATNGSTIYVTYMPCHECAKAIIQAGIKEVVYMYNRPSSREGNNILTASDVVLKKSEYRINDE